MQVSSNHLTRLTVLALGLPLLAVAQTVQGTATGGPIPAGAFVTSGILTSDIVLTNPGLVATGNAVTVNLLGLQHDFAGDLQISLSYINAQGTTVQSVDVLNRIGTSISSPWGTAADFGNDQGAGDNYLFNSDYPGNIWTTAACSDPPACTTPYGDADSLPGVSTDSINRGQYFTSTTGGTKTNLSYAFTGLSVSGGTWRLTVTDAADPNIGSFIGWQIIINTSSGTSGSPASVTPVAGTPQSATVGTSFPAALQAKVADSSGNPLSGITITFSAPSAGASATFSGANSATAVTNSSGIAISPVPSANSMAGAYVVSASVSGLTSAIFSLANTATTGTATATYVGTDTTTQGGWTGKYGADARVIPDDVSSQPPYGNITLNTGVAFTWAPSTTDPRALQTSGGSATRIASCFYDGNDSLNFGPNQFSIDVNLTDGTHQLSLYLLDWDRYSRNQSISILDAGSGTVLNTQTFSSFGNGVWAVWTVKGHVTVQVSNNGTTSANAVINGIFLDTTTTIGTTAGATYVGSDTSTQGTWSGKYGADASVIANDITNQPSYGSIALNTGVPFTWISATTDPRALQSTSNSASRIASCFYDGNDSLNFGPNQFSIDVNLTDGNTHQLSIYLLDWDHESRNETISVLDSGSNTVLSTQTFSSFSNGVWAVWTVKGHITILVSNNGSASANAVVNGIFLDTPSTVATTAAASYIGSDTATQGTWTGKYGVDASVIPNDITNQPPYGSIALSTGTAFTWAPATADPRALQIVGGSSTRIASCYYDGNDTFNFGPNQFSIDVNLTDSSTHQMSLYLLDWDNENRNETISILDAGSKAVLSSQTFSNFASGVYGIWMVKGHVTVRVLNNGTASANAVVNGIFLK